MGARIVGWATALPEKIVTNDDLASYLDTSDEWIVERTGIRERRVGGTTSVLAIDAGRQAMERAGVDPASVGLVVLSTATPDAPVPATSATVQHALGIGGGAMDLNAACAGFVYGLVTSCALAHMGMNRILMIGCDALSKITDWDDRNTAVLFGDGAGAVVIEAVDGPGSLLGWHLDADGSAAHLIYAEYGGFLHMEGREVFRRAVRVMVESTQISLAKAGLTVDDLALVVPHQANLRIIDAACQRLGIPMSKTAVCLDHTGNTSSASIPLALVEAVEAGRLKDGEHVLMVGFGAGMTVASAVMRWGA